MYGDGVKYVKANNCEDGIFEVKGYSDADCKTVVKFTEQMFPAGSVIYDWGKCMSANYPFETKYMVLTNARALGASIVASMVTAAASLY